MLSVKNRVIYFISLCIPLRIIISLLPLYMPENYLFYMGLITLIPSFVFLYLYFFNKRLNAFEAGGKTWWSNLRLIHGLLYLCASIYLLQSKRLAFIPFIADVIIGLLSFLFEHKYL